MFKDNLFLGTAANGCFYMHLSIVGCYDYVALLKKQLTFDIYLLIADKRSISTRCEICLKLTIKIP